MPLREILLHMDQETDFQTRLYTAFHLAHNLKAHVTALQTGVSAGPDTSRRRTSSQQKELENARTQFDEFAAELDVVARWRTCDATERDDIAAEIIRRTRCADLAIIGQPDPHDRHPLSGGLIDRVILGSGKPIMVIPPKSHPAPSLEHVLVAWDGGREATRAVTDAIPLLETAQSVHVLNITQSNPNPVSIRTSGEDLCQYLARHRVPAKPRTVTQGDRLVGEILMQVCAENPPDLLIMGAYGHARITELVLGGVTRYMLRHAPAPVLMSR